MQANQIDGPHDASGGAGDLAEVTTYKSASKQHRKRKRTGSTSEDSSGDDRDRPFILQEDDIVTDRRSRYLERVGVG